MSAGRRDRARPVRVRGTTARAGSRPDVRGTGTAAEHGAAGSRSGRGAHVSSSGRAAEPLAARLLVARSDADRGSVTAELAVGIVSVTLVLVTVLAVGAATTTRLVCLDAARTAARVAALGEPAADAVAAARHVLGWRDADVRLRRDGSWVTVEVDAPFAGWPGADRMRARASATAWAEP